MKSLSKKRGLGMELKKDLNITERKRAGSQREAAFAAQRASKELEAIKQSENESREYSESIINTVREPLIILDQDLRVVSASRSFYEFFKVKPEETVGKLIYDLGKKEWDIPKLRELLETILPQKATFDNYEVEHEFPKIGRRVMLLNARQIQRGAGKEQIILLAIEDITKHKQLEIFLAESEELYKGVFKTASDGILLLEKGEGKITHTNPAAEKMLGYSTKECIGKKLQDIGFMLGMGDFQTTMQNLNKNGIINYKDVQAKTRSGQHLVTDIYLVDKTKVIQCNIRDITDRTRAEEALRKSENKFFRAFRAIPDVLVISRPANGLIIEVNDSWDRLFGYSREETIGRSSLEMGLFKNPADRQNVVAQLQEQKFVRNFEVEIKCKSGEVRQVALSVEIIEIDSEPAMLTIIHDITERKRAGEKMRNSLAEKELLLKEVHHRVKNNLMTIIGLINMQETKAHNKMFHPLLKELEGRVRAMALVHESLHKSEDLTHVDLQNYVETMSSQIRAQFGAERDIRFSVQAAGVEAGLDIAVPSGLILNELIANAYKHAFPGDKPRAGAVDCEISIVVGQEGCVLTLTVADNGIGLPAGLDWENPRTTGLQLVKMLSQQLNGSIEVERSSGTLFRLKFPVAVI
jgi:PAS domain S-box-containing protein